MYMLCVRVIREIGMCVTASLLPFGCPLRGSFKLPLTAKSVTVLLFCCFRGRIQSVNGWAAESEGYFLDQDPAGTVRRTWGSAARVLTHSSPPSSLNRADLLSWVDMGKIGTGFPGICHRLFNDINAFLALQIHHVAFLSFLFRSRMDQMNHTSNVV